MYKPIGFAGWMGAGVIFLLFFTGGAILGGMLGGLLGLELAPGGLSDALKGPEPPRQALILALLGGVLGTIGGVGAAVSTIRTAIQSDAGTRAPGRSYFAWVAPRAVGLAAFYGVLVTNLAALFVALALEASPGLRKPEHLAPGPPNSRVDRSARSSFDVRLECYTRARSRDR